MVLGSLDKQIAMQNLRLGIWEFTWHAGRGCTNTYTPFSISGRQLKMGL